jgi:hypothetical protein
MIIKTVQAGYLIYAIEAIKGTIRYSYIKQRNLSDFIISVAILIMLVVLIIFNFILILMATP